MTVRVGVSACLLGQRVRWDGSDRLADHVAGLAGAVELIPFCPEVELGLGVPRPAIDLVDRGGAVTLEGPGGDLTGPMRALSRARSAALIEAKVSGYILKSRSPSCGLRDVPVIRDGERVEAGATGLFAATLAEQIRGLPLADERELADPERRRSFLTRAGAWARVAELFGFDLERSWTRGELVAHHSREKLLLMAHSPESYRRLGALVAAVAGHEPRAFAARYRRELVAALEEPPDTGRHVNAMQHIAGYFEGDDRREAGAAIAAFARGELELDEVRARLLEAAERAGQTYLAEQTYLVSVPERGFAAGRESRVESRE